MGKIFQDSVHGTIELCDKSIRIIDTPEFQRLRNIKQLGVAYYVFPSASHNRFEHSLGVAYLARSLLEHIKKNQVELEITEQDLEDIEIAGLCHDLGHGPFSHLFDDIYLRDKEDTLYRYHEDRSIEILRMLITKYDINISKDSFKKISLMIKPDEKVKKHFLYQIVSNSRNGIDVDKFDYIARDSKALGINFGFEHHRIFPYVRVIKNEICFCDKIIFNIYELFDNRFKLHKQVYNHPTIKKIELMVEEYLRNLDKIYPKINKVMEDLQIFCTLTDTILDLPFLVDEDHYKKEDVLLMRKMIENIKNRKLYEKVDEIKLKPLQDINEAFYEWKIKNKVEGDFLYCKKKLSFSGSPQNPLYKVKFYSREKNKIIGKREIDNVMGNIMPRQFEEFSMVIFQKN